MTIGSHELALTIINDGEGYKKRCNIAKQYQGAAIYAQSTARLWLNVVLDGAQQYEKQFGTPDTASSFTVEDILLAAIELADYYAQHVKEL